MTVHDERDDYDDEPRGRPLAPDHVVRWPANVMWGLGWLQLIFTQFFAVLLVTVEILVNFVDGGKTLADLWRDFEDLDSYYAPVAWLLMTGCNIFVIRAGNDMRSFRRYWRVVVAAVMTTLAVPFVYFAVFQLPLGIWILVVIARRDVRARFEAVARVKMTMSPTEASNARPDRPA